MNPNLVQRMRPHYYTDIRDQLQQIFYEVIFQPLCRAITAANPSAAKTLVTLENRSTPSALEEALRTGRVQYTVGIFSGSFSAAIGKELRALDASWDPRTKTYRISETRVPGWVRAVAAGYRESATATHKTLQKVLDDIQLQLDRALDKRKVKAQKTIGMIETGFKPAADALRVSPTITPDSKERLAADYTNNMQLLIKKFSEEEIAALRLTVEQNAEAGFRFDALVDKIKMRYNVSRTKAEFLARQETSLFMSKFRRERFSEAGVTHYKWSTAHDSRVRPMASTKGRARLNDHRHLDGRIFAYADPPIVDRANGRKANPGEDYGCRCVDIPMLEPVKAAA